MMPLHLRALLNRNIRRSPYRHDYRMPKGKNKSDFEEPKGQSPFTGAVEWLSLESLKPAPRNARTHTKKQIRQIAESINQFGFINPVLVSRQNHIVAGHGRVDAAKLLGMEKVPTIRLENMSDADLRAYALADNKIAENAGWDHELVALEFEYLSELDINFDLTIMGFETSEIDIILGEVEPDEEDSVPEPDREVPAVTRPGDLWLIGKHHLLCGDATRLQSFHHLMSGKRAQLIFTDPPYNLEIDGNVCGLGSIKHREFAMASGEMSEKQFTNFLTTVFNHLTTFSSDGSIHFVCIDWRHMSEMLAAGKKAYTELLNVCVWNKTNAGMGSLYRSKHEIVFVFKCGASRHINNVQLGQHGRYRTNVWDYPGNSSFGKERDELLAMHPTVKPVALVADAIKDCSKRGGIVLDVFAGSGTTLVAAEKTGRVGYALEIDPHYVDVALARLQQSAGLEAVHSETKLTFQEMQTHRAEGTAAPRKAARSKPIKETPNGR